MTSVATATRCAVMVSVALLGCTEPSRARQSPPRNTSSDLVAFSRIDKAWASSKGNGATVAVVDWQFDPNATAAPNFAFATSMIPGEVIGGLKPWHGAWMVDIVHRVAPEAKIIPIIARSLEVRNYQDGLARAIRYAAEHGAAAVTSSMGPADQTDALREAVDVAERQGTLFVNVHPENTAAPGEKLALCGAGQCDPRIVHSGIVSVPEHPTRPDEARLVYTWPYDLDAKFEDGWGFSNGPPIVGGVIALMKSVNPKLSPAQIRQLLAQTAYEREGFKVLDAEAAVKSAIAMR